MNFPNRSEAIIWKPEYAIGIDAIDTDHQILVALLNQIFTAIGDPEEAMIMASVLKMLVSYTDYHFTREEKLLEVAGYPELSAHRALHHQLAEQVIALADRYEDDPTSVRGREVHGFLKTWLINHILGEDHRYRATCLGNSAAIAAASAITFESLVDASADGGRHFDAGSVIDWSTKRILSIDDNKNFRRIVATVLEAFKVKVLDFADNGVTGISRASAGNYDLILCDWKIGDIDGIEAVRAIRKAGIAVPIIICTGYGSTLLREAARAAGASGFLEKPITALDLIETASECLIARDVGQPNR